MRAVLSRRAGGPETLELSEADFPRPGPGQLLVRTCAVALNFLDVLVIEDRYQARPARPFSPGCELSGVIAEVGADVRGFSVGDRVVAQTDFGALAEFVGTDPARTFALPQEMPFDTAAAMLVTYGTTYHALIDRAQLRSGETLLVLGATGGVGIAAIQLGKALDAHVVAAVSSAKKAAAATTAGADRTLIYPLQPLERDGARALAMQFKEIVGGRGADVIYDPVGGDYCEPALRAIAWNGRYLVVGFAAGIPRIPLNLALLKECSLSGVFWGDYVKRTPHRFAEQFLKLIELWKHHKIQPQISARFTMEKAREALQAINDRDVIGKVIVEMSSLQV